MYRITYNATEIHVVARKLGGRKFAACVEIYNDGKLGDRFRENHLFPSAKTAEDAALALAFDTLILGSTDTRQVVLDASYKVEYHEDAPLSEAEEADAVAIAAAAARVDRAEAKATKAEAKAAKAAEVKAAKVAKVEKATTKATKATPKRKGKPAAFAEGKDNADATGAPKRKVKAVPSKEEIFNGAPAGAK